ncbi:helix-turn-helix domain-containing protein [Halococcus agarilyticus]|uniref:helix-turn-helix domain-containing protein n=1 Tax=Halococcus agarilyticus TaxID=1232219 RepID=UPI000677BC0B|nr:helix-turn-helix domain-containing protein [Halococcus agarilyticus]
MTTIAELELPAEEFALWETLDAMPTARFEIVKVVARDRDCAIPYLWAKCDDLPALEDALANDPSVEEATRLEELEGEALYRMEWTYQIRVLVHILVEEEGTVLNARGGEGRWRFRVLFPTRDSLSTTHEFCENADYSITVEQVYELDSARQGRFGLTEEQYETLTTALDLGFYEIPREIDMESLAAEFDISYQSVSERLRRGHRNFIRNGLGWGSLDEDTSE